MSDFPPQFAAGLNLLRHTGMNEFQIRFQDELDPVVWMVVATHGEHHTVAAALDPTMACMKLCEDVIDGGECANCGKVTTFIIPGEPAFPRPLGTLVLCSITFDAESGEFVRSCGGGWSDGEGV